MGRGGGDEVRKRVWHDAHAHHSSVRLGKKKKSVQRAQIIKYKGLMVVWLKVS